MRVAEFGPLIVETDVDRAVIDQLKLWFPTELAQIERERGLDNESLGRPKDDSFANVLEDDEFLDHTLPAILVTTASTEGDIPKDGNGFYRATFLVVISAVLRGRTPPETRTNAALFGGAIKRILTGMPSVGGFANGTSLVSSAVAPIKDSTRAGRYLCASISQFHVLMDHIAQEGAGPLLPDPPQNPYDPPDPDNTDPYDPLTAVGEVNVTIEEKN